jgi:hypothetical protein
MRTKEKHKIGHFYGKNSNKLFNFNLSAKKKYLRTQLTTLVKPSIGIN